MEHTIAQPDLPVRHAEAGTSSLASTMAAAAAGTVGRAIGSRLAARAQELIKRFAENRR